MKNIKKVSLVILITLLFLGIFSVTSHAGISASGGTIKPGETVTINVSSSQSVGAFKVSLTDLGGLEFVGSSCSLDNSAGEGSKTITGITTKGTTSLASFKVKAPSNSESKTYKVTFQVGDLLTPDETPIASQSATASVTVKKDEPASQPDPKPSENTNTGGNSGGSTENPSTPAKKSSDASLKNIVVSPVDFTGFKSGNNGPYEVNFENNMDKATIKATTSNAKASIRLVNKTNSDTGKSWVAVEEGRNEISVIVTAEDGTQKTYTIIVNRATKQDEIPNNQEEPKDPEEEKKDLALVSLSIEGLDLNPEFKADVHEYRALLADLTVEKLDIKAKSNIETATVEITGNENLVEGENVITILLKYEDKTATYQITIVKSTKVGENNIENTSATNETVATSNSPVEKKGGLSLLWIIAIGVIAVIAIAALIAFIITQIRCRKRKKVDLEEVDYINNFNNMYDTSTDEMPIEEGKTEDIAEQEDRKKKDDRKGKHF